MAGVIPIGDDSYSRELGEGLLVRWSTPEDVEQVAALYSYIFRSSAEAPLNWHIPHWTRDMFSGRHPLIGPRDFAVVEDTTTSTIVASTCLLGYTIAFEGIPVPFGRPEVVATLPEYRNRGLIRAIFHLIHAKSEARGDLVQGITGIQNYYRQFGYEYAIAEGIGLTVYFPAIPVLESGAPEPYTLRQAALEDLPLLLRLAEREQVGAAITTPITETYYRWSMEGVNPEGLNLWRSYLIVDSGERTAGYVRLRSGRWGVEMGVDGLMVEEGVPLAGVMPSVLRGVQALADTTKPNRPGRPPAGAVWLHLPSTAHPLVHMLGDLVPVRVTYPFGDYPEPWYIRVPDLPRFIRHAAPALERRLAASAQAGYSGELTLDFYRGGLLLKFADGKLAEAEAWRRPPWGAATAGISPLVFLQLLFGYRSLHELRGIYPDVFAEGEAAAVLDALFPKQHASLIPLD